MTDVSFREPLYLWLLLVPAVLLLLLGWNAVRRRRDVRRMRQGRLVPVRERFAYFGGLRFWTGLCLALALTVLAVSRPSATVALVRTAGIDLIVLQDGSASMHVRDVRPDRWQRSMKFLKVLAQSMEWTNDRIALALFAHIAAPQVRLTRDPNTLFFFLEHLGHQSPFPLEDESTWDTNIELGLHWGLRLLDRDEQLHGPSPNAKAFVLVSDGQAWSGEIQRALKIARAKDIPVFVVGVGTSAGGFIPEPTRPIAAPYFATPPPRVHSTLDRTSLSTISTAGGGRYFDLERETDRAIAATIVGTTRRQAGSRGIETTSQDLYWYCLLSAAVLLCLSVVSLDDPSELWLGAPASALALYLFWRLIQ